MTTTSGQTSSQLLAATEHADGWGGSARSRKSTSVDKRRHAHYLPTGTVLTGRTPRAAATVLLPVLAGCATGVLPRGDLIEDDLTLQ